MKKKDLILKWLDYEPLSELESKAFNELDASDSFTKISETAKQFGSPHFDVEENLEVLTSSIANIKNGAEKNNRFNYRDWFLRIAAVFILGFGLYFAFFTSPNTVISTLASEKTTINLPDQSVVVVNALSSIVYNENNWSSNRQIELEGEAFFKVAKGQKFDVKTSAGVVSVLGTQFNIKIRDNYFEVTCFEGLVGVSYNGKEIKLPAGKTLNIINKSETNQNIDATAPDWTYNKSTFRSTPLHFVLREFERQYNIKIVTKNIDQNTVFTGNFVHSNLQTALQSITIPMRLNYVIENNLITLYKE